MHELEGYRGEKVNDCIDAITQLSKSHGIDKINVMDPVYNLAPIDNDNHRLNIRTDASGIILKFSIG